MDSFPNFLCQVEHPLFTEMIDSALSVLPVDAGPQHVKLLLEWNEPDEFFCDTSDAFVEHESVSQLQVRFANWQKSTHKLVGVDKVLQYNFDIIFFFITSHKSQTHTE